MSDAGTSWLEQLIAIEARAITHEVTPALADVQRIAVISDAFLPKLDGVTRSALLTILYLQTTGRVVEVFAPAPTIPAVRNVPVHAIPALPVPTASGTRAALPWPRLIFQLRRFRPDLIHLFSPLSLGSMGMLAGWLLGVPVIANYQTDLPAYSRSYGVGFVRQHLIGALRYLHNGCTLNLAPSQATLRDLRSWGIRRIRLWPRGIDAERFTPSCGTAQWREKLLAGRDPGALVALYVGRIAKDKHLETLSAVGQLPGVALTLVGSGDHQPALERYFTKHGASAHFMGVLFGDDLAAAFASADVFIFPGPEETFGQVVLEALASGLPVLVTDRGGPADLVEDGQTGYICPADDPETFAARVVQLRDDPGLRKRMGQAARKAALTRPWSPVLRQLEDYYAEAQAMQRRLQRIRKTRS